MRRTGIVGLLLLIGLIVRGVLAQETSSVTGGDDAALRAFIARYVGGGGPAPVNVVVGGLPNLGFNIPVPPGTTMVGTIIRPDAAVANLNFYEILLENVIAPTDVLAFYKQALAAEGWTLIYEDNSSSGGFVESAFVAGSFCRNGLEANLSFDAISNPQLPGKTLITLRIQTPADEYQCLTPDQSVVDITFTLIPPLRVPEEVTLISNTGGGLSYYAADARSTSVTAIMNATLPLAQLAEAYNTQLVEAGWVQVTNDITERSAFSTWTITASDNSAWHGAFLLLADTVTPGQFNAMVWVEE